MSLSLGLASLRVLLGLVGVGYSLLKAAFGAGASSLSNEILKAVVGETAGGLTYDFLKGGGDAALKQIADSLQAGDSDNLNHDLQKAARKAQLSATLLAVRACLKETKRLNEAEKSLWAKARGWVRTDENEKWLNEVAAMLRRKIDKLPQEVPSQNVADDEIFDLFDPKLNLEPTELQKQFVAKLKTDALTEIRTEYYPTPFSDAAYKLLDEAIQKGWNESRDDQTPPALRSLYPLGLKSALINTGRQYDWFSLVCGLFNEEYKNNPRVGMAIQKYLLLDIQDRHGNVLTKEDGQPAPLAAGVFFGHLEAFGDSFVRLEELLKTIDAKQDRVLVGQEEILFFVKDRFEGLAKRIDEVIQTVVDESEKTQSLVVNKSNEILQHQREMSAAYVERQAATNERFEEINRNVKKLAAESQKQRIDRNPIPNPLPSADDVFDRTDECARLKALLAAEDTRLVTILAPSGYGKTKLVAKFLQSIAPHSRLSGNATVDGVLFISCRDSSTGKVWSDVFDKAGLMIGKREEFAEIFKRDIQEQISYLFTALNEAGSFWIVLDNFEDLLNKEELTIGDDKHDPVRNLLHHAFELAVSQRFVITTQRTPVFVGRNAPVLREEHHIHVGGTPEDDAVRYLREEGARFMLREVGENILRDFVRRVDCLPLVVVSLIRHLDKYFKRKPKGSITLAGVEKEINASGTYVETDKENGLRNWLTEQIFDLPVDEKLVLSVLSVFREPCPKGALAFMLPNFSDEEIEEVLAQLERDQLLYQEGRGFQLSAIIRECVYGLIPKTAANEGDNFNQTALHTRAADFYASDRKRAEQWMAIEDLASQFEEMYHCRQAGLYSRAATVFDLEAVEYLRRAGYSRRLLEEWLSLIDKPLDDKMAAYIGDRLANVYSDLGNLDEAIKYFNETLAVYRKLKDKEGEGKSLANIGRMHSALGNTERAMECFEQALEIFRTSGSKLSEGRVLRSIGAMYFRSDETEKAIEYSEQALKIHIEVGDSVNIGIVSGNLGAGYAELGDTQRSLMYYEQALQIHRDVGSKIGEGIVLGNIGMTKFESGEEEEGIRLVEQALAIARQVEDKWYEEMWLGKLEKMRAGGDGLDVRLNQQTPNSGAQGKV